MVVGIIAILIGIVTTAASQSLRASRSSRASAAMKVVQTGLAAYHAMMDEWPIPNLAKKSGNHGSGQYKDENIYDLTAKEVRECVMELVEQTKKGNPLIDVTGLWVSRYDGDDPNKKVSGMDFWSAIHGTRKLSKKKMKLADMYFGYPRESDGYFERFGMGYSIPSDSLTVGYRDSYLGTSSK